MDLTFDLHNMFVSNEMEEFSHFPKMPGSKLTYIDFKPEDLELFDRVRSEFIRRVDQNMMHFFIHSCQKEFMQVTKIRSLRVDFLLGDEHREVIDRWIVVAIAMGAERIELLFSNRTYYFLPNQVPYIVAHTLFSEMNHLHLQNCYLWPHVEFSGFKQLKTLELDQLVVEEILFLCLFSKCLLLEDLTFLQCHFNYAADIISPTLLHLKLILCELPRKIDIVTTNLSSFEYGGDISLLPSIKAPQLLKFYLNPGFEEELGISHVFTQLACFHQLQNLSMIFLPFQIFLDGYMSSWYSRDQVASLPRTIGPFQHLRELELFYGDQDEKNEDHLWVLNIVMACPSLQKLYFGIVCPKFFVNQRERREHPGFSHNELKYVELHGCVGQMIEIELAIHFLKNVNSLKSITFSPLTRWHTGGGKWHDGFDHPYWYETGRNLISEKLQDHVNGQTQLIFLDLAPREDGY